MSEEKSIRIISFTGKRNDWRVWSRKFLAVAEKRGYKKVLTGTLTISSDSTDEEKQLGVNAYNDLLLAMTEGISFGLVDESTSSLCPDGDAAKAWKKLKARYESQTSASKVKIMGQLHASRLTKKSKDPEVWISELEILRSRLNEMGTTIEDEFLILHILNNLPSEYDNVVENLEERVDSVINPLGIEDVRQKLSEKFEKMKIRKKFKNDSDDEDEQALYTTKFKGRCNKCGKFGHKAKDCRSNPDSNDNQEKKRRFNGKCHYCGKVGHKEIQCWLKHGKPKDKANTAKDGKDDESDSEDEVVLMCMEVTEECDFAGVSFSSPDEIEVQEKEQSIPDDDKNTEGTEKETVEIKNQNEANEEEEIIPGVTARMVRPFVREDWTQDMVEEFERFTSHELGSEEINDLIQDEKEKLNTGTEESQDDIEPKEINFMSKESKKNSKEVESQVWIGDTGASCHMTNSMEGLTNLRSIDSKIIFGNGEQLKATHVGNKKGYVCQIDGTEKPITLQKVKFVPKLACNLFSISAALQNGCKMEGSKELIKVMKGKYEYIFDRKIKSGKGNLYGIQIINKMKDKAYLSMNRIHEMLGHPSEEITKATANKMKFHVNEKMKKCEHCDIAKMKKKNMNKTTLERAEKPGDRLFMDISSIKYPSAGGAKFWALFVDDSSDFLFGIYMKRKSDLRTEGIKLLNTIANNFQIKIKRIRCDNAGENKSFEKEIIEKKLKIIFEYTASNTPQQNGRVERKFATIYGRVRSMLTAAGIEGELRKSLWAEAGNTAIDLMNIQVHDKEQRTPYEKISGRKTLPNYSKSLKPFGEIGIILRPNKIKSKIEDRGQRAMMVGYGTQSSVEVYRMYKFDTGNITKTRDIRWTGKMYGESDLKINDDISSSESESDYDEDSKKEDEDVKPLEDEETSKKVYNALKKLHTSYNPTLSALVVEDDLALVGGTDDLHENPISFDQAWNHEDKEERMSWQDAIKKEFGDMIERGVWKHTHKKDVPKDRRLIGNKWVFKKKRNGVYRARLVALGYAQIPGVDHKDNFAPVVSEIAFRLILIMGLMSGWIFEIVDIETAFLYGELEEEIYMKIPEGLRIYEQKNYDDEACLILKKSIYGLVQAARQFHKKLVYTLTQDMGFVKCAGDECLLMRRNDTGTVVICLYIDDTLCAGEKESITLFKKELRKFFATKEEGIMDEYVGCQVKKINEKCVVMHQSELIGKMERIFKEDIRELKKREMPFGTNNRVIRPSSDEQLISKEEQTRYRSGIGMLLYLVKYSRPDLSNAVRELSKVNDGATNDHVKSLLRVIKFAIDTKNKVLLYKINDTRENDWKLKAYSDSDWAGDADDRRSITGFCIFLNGCLISWKSRGQKTVTLSSSEAEYVAVSEVCAEILFIKTLMDFLKLEVDLPITVMCDNVGAIFIDHNSKNNGRTKHISVKHHFIREYVVDGTVQIKFVRSEENLADPFTKNVSRDSYLKHSAKYLKDMEEIDTDVLN